MSTDSAKLLFQFGLIAVLTSINAFFASAEMAIVSLNKNRLSLLAKKGNRKALMLEKLLKEPTKFLSTIQVGITLAGFFSSASAARSISVWLGQYLGSLGAPYGEQIAFVSVTVVLSYVTLVFGELYPKRVALQNSEKIAMASVFPIVLVSKLTKPFVALLSISTDALTRATGMKSSELKAKVSREEIRSLVNVGKEHGVINETEREMLDSVFRFDDKLAKEIMTPRTDVFLVDLESSRPGSIEEIVLKKYSRVPLYSGDIDNIVGVLLLKDLVTEAYSVGFENVDLKKLMRPPYFVPERKYIDDLFKDMQRSSQNMSILVDEYGGFSGIVTIEDLIEEVMGEIWDEFEESRLPIFLIEENLYRVDGTVTIEDLNEHLGLDLNEDSEDYDTVGGLVIFLFGHIPKDDEEVVVRFQNLSFKVLGMKGNRVESVEMKVEDEESA